MAYLNPGTAAVRAIHDFMLEREAAKDRELARKHQSELEKRQIDREERQAKIQQEQFEYTKELHEEAKKERGYKRTEERIDRMLPGDVPDPELVTEAQKYGLSDRFMKRTLPSSGLPGIAAVPVGQEQTGVQPQEAYVRKPSITEQAVIDKKAAQQKLIEQYPVGSKERQAAEYYISQGLQIPVELAKGIFKLGGTGQPLLRVDARGDRVDQFTNGKWEPLVGPVPDNAHWVQVQHPPQAAGQGAEKPDSGDVARAAAVVLGGNMSPSQAIAAFGGMGVNAAQFKRAMNLEIVRQNPNFNFQEAESNYQFGKNAGTQSTVRYIDNLQNSLPALKRISDKFKRDTSIKTINRAILQGKAEIGDVDAQNFIFAMTGIADEMAKVLQGGGTGVGTTDTKMKQALELFDKGMTADQLDGVLDTAEEFLKYRRDSLTKGTYMANPAAGGSKTTTRKRYDINGKLIQ